MDRRVEKIISRTQQAGIKQSLRVGHALSKEEVLGLKIQVMPMSLRSLLFCCGVGFAIAGLIHCLWYQQMLGVIFLLSALLCVLFGIFGIRRTVGRIIDSIDLSVGVDILETVVDGIGSAVGSLLD